MTPLYKIIIPESKGDSASFPQGEVYAKMEMFNPTGTHKDRSIEPWILEYKNKGEKEFVISSSGNSAVSAAKYSDDFGLRLHVFVPRSADPVKLEKIRKQKNISLSISKTPKSDAIKFAKKKRLVNLRASVDDFALEGYKSIAYELIKQLPKIDNIFVPTSSGTTLEGIYSGYKENSLTTPSFYAVQTAKVHPIVSCFDKNFTREKLSHANAIVDNIAHRKNRVIDIIKETVGGGYAISNKELKDARKTLSSISFLAPGLIARENVGWQSALSFAGFLKWERKNPKDAISKISVCLFTD